MNTVISKDGTSIAYDKMGEGKALILVSGALGWRSHPMMSKLAEHLASQFTVYNYDRRGRGDSTDTAPYSVQREIEDIEALIEVAGGSAYLYGISSGAVLALEASNKLSQKVNKLALYEPPFIIDDSRAPVPAELDAQLEALITENRNSDAVKLFFKQAMGIPAIIVFMIRWMMPQWSEMTAIAHTMRYDLAVMSGKQTGNPLPENLWNAVHMPTLVIVGEKSERFFHTSAKSLVENIPSAQFHSLAGQDHAVSEKVLAPVLNEFFLSSPLGIQL